VVGHLQCTSQQPPEDLVTAIAEEAVRVDPVVLAIEPKLDLTGWILSWAGCLEESCTETDMGVLCTISPVLPGAESSCNHMVQKRH